MCSNSNPPVSLVAFGVLASIAREHCELDHARQGCRLAPGEGKTWRDSISLPDEARTLEYESKAYSGTYDG